MAVTKKVRRNSMRSVNRTKKGSRKGSRKSGKGTKRTGKGFKKGTRKGSRTSGKGSRKKVSRKSGKKVYRKSGKKVSRKSGKGLRKNVSRKSKKIIMKGGRIDMLTTYSSLVRYTNTQSTVLNSTVFTAAAKREKIIGIQAISLVILLSIYNQLQKTNIEYGPVTWEFQPFETGASTITLINRQAIIYNQFDIILLLKMIKTLLLNSYGMDIEEFNKIDLTKIQNGQNGQEDIPYKDFIYNEDDSVIKKYSELRKRILANQKTIYLYIRTNLKLKSGVEFKQNEAPDEKISTHIKGTSDIKGISPFHKSGWTNRNYILYNEKILLEAIKQLHKRLNTDKIIKSPMPDIPIVKNQVHYSPDDEAEDESTGSSLSSGSLDENLDENLYGKMENNRVFGPVDHGVHYEIIRPDQADTSGGPDQADTSGGPMDAYAKVDKGQQDKEPGTRPGKGPGTGPGAGVGTGAGPRAGTGPAGATGAISDESAYAAMSPQSVAPGATGPVYAAMLPQGVVSGASGTTGTTEDDLLKGFDPTVYADVSFTGAPGTGTGATVHQPATTPEELRGFNGPGESDQDLDI